ncbi:SH3 domain-containing protein [uncultured Jannaschia sp.]|uniref:SH3 domain-containing protein n=1 Tax=uncultured Jannaschia sp. TaxID=293347 RepID=UPI002634298F|nr:SH3 domain-containing protein [uncultured Jannaschia sp.]
MLKLTLTLCLAVYAGFVVWGQPIERTDGQIPVRPVMAAQASSGYDRPVILSDAQDGAASVTRTAVASTIVPDAAAIAAAAPAPDAQMPRRIGEPVMVRLSETDDAAPASDSDRTATEAEAALFRVTGSRVNMRSGPSTAYGVIDSLAEGTLAERVGEADEGWMEIRVPDTGRTGYMSARFLQPA